MGVEPARQSAAMIPNSSTAGLQTSPYQTLGQNFADPSRLLFLCQPFAAALKILWVDPVHPWGGVVKQGSRDKR